MSTEVETELAVVGAGPAGCAAALMADSVGVSCVLLERGAVGGRLRSVPEILNMPGVADDGPSFADRMVRQLARADVAQLRVDVETIRPDEGGVVLSGGHSDVSVRARWLVWAAGLVPLRLVDHPSVTVADEDFSEMMLLGENFDHVASADGVVIVGADRPVSTFFRSTQARSPDVTVVCMLGEEYKLDELRLVAPHVRVVTAGHVTVEPTGQTRCRVTVETREGPCSLGEVLVVTNLGSAPNTAPIADLVDVDASGYPAGSTAAPITCVGDVAHVSHQRAAIAIGDGARSALSYYYMRVGAYGHQRPGGL